VAAAATAALLLALAGVPWWGRDLAFFRVRSVEVRGTRFARPADIVSRLRLDTTASVWTPLDSLEARVERHPQVRSATVRRWLPSRIIVEVSENEPIALVPGDRRMRAYDEAGRVLPIDPARVSADLPVVERPDTSVFRLLADLKADNPAMYARISEVRLVGRDQLRISLVDVRVLAMRGLGAERFDELSSVEQDLARRRLVAIELDLRFKDQVIARLP
jgi:cell division protein FtsQ